MNKGLPRKLPNSPSNVGGEVDILIGIQYLKYFPGKVASLKSGLTLGKVTLIYGVKSSGNQAERALRLTAENMSESYPEASKCFLNDIYVDDCISGTNSKSKLMPLKDELKVGLEPGGFTLKGFTFAGSDPDVHLSADGKSNNVGGLKWYSQEDTIGIKVSKLNFEKELQG